jgi:hypothetical protein
VTRRAGGAVVLLVAGVVLAGCAATPSRGARRLAHPSGSATTVTPAAPAAVAPSTTAASPGPGEPCGTTATPPAHYRHVVWIWMENHTWGSVIGTSAAPFLTSLAHQCGTDSNWASVGSPSLPNYLGATSGSTQGVTDDGDPSQHSFAADNLFRQVRAAGGTERSFAEAMPGNCQLVSQGAYAAKHNPAVYYDGPGDRAACQADDVPFSRFPAVLASGQLPTYSSITPDICDDMHDCSVATGDRWLATWVPRILATASYRSGSTALFIVWDEPTPLANVVVAPSVRPGTVASAAVNHYSLLAATEEMLGLPLLSRAAGAPSLRGVFGI